MRQDKKTTEKVRRQPVRIKHYILVALIFIAVVVLLSIFAHHPPVIDSVVADGQLSEDGTAMLTVTVEPRFYDKNQEFQCYLGPAQNAADIPDDAWVTTTDHTACFEVPPGSYYVFVKDRNGVVSRTHAQDAAINDILAIDINYESLVLPLNDSRRFEAYIFVLGDIDDAVVWTSSDNSVASIVDGTLYTHAPGEITVTATAANGLEATADIIVTDLFQKAVIDPSKPRVPAYHYTQDEAHLLDRALASRVNEAGLGTRAGVVAAGRFLTMEFPYLVPYFYENGRLVNHHNKYVDGEGRYYHVGLYLSVDKYDDISAAFVGPAIWGAPLTNFEDSGYFVPGVQYPNGLDCSGFVTWALLNGGFDPGDVGAGDYIHRDDDLCDLGEQVPLTMELVESGRIKVGDLIGEDGHIALIIGMTDEHIYIAESLGRGVRVSVLTWRYGLFNAGIYDYVMLMDSYYGEDGDLTDFWE